MYMYMYIFESVADCPFRILSRSFGENRFFSSLVPRPVFAKNYVGYVKNWRQERPGNEASSKPNLRDKSGTESLGSRHGDYRLETGIKSISEL